MNLSEYRLSMEEVDRTQDLMRLTPNSGRKALDVGARDGHFSILLADRLDRVVALDLEEPAIIHPRIECIAGNAVDLKFEDNSFDFVLCTEVLEHVPTAFLSKVCEELTRVCSHRLLIGVPNRQELRVGRTTCSICGGKNPPWGHINRFDEKSLSHLFPKCTVETKSFVGITKEQTNAVAVFLMDVAGNPYGTYHQEEPCIFCGRKLVMPSHLSYIKKAISRLGIIANNATGFLATPRGNWLHILMTKNAG